MKPKSYAPKPKHQPLNGKNSEHAQVSDSSQRSDWSFGVTYSLEISGLVFGLGAESGVRVNIQVRNRRLLVMFSCVVAEHPHAAAPGHGMGVPFHFGLQGV